MWVYYLPVFILGLLQFKVKNVYCHISKKDKLCYASLLLILIAGLRGSGAGDYYAYVGYVSKVNSVNEVIHNNISMEIGYRILAYLINFMHLPGQFIIIAMSVISLMCIKSLIEKYSCNAALSFLIYMPFFFQFDMHATRTAVAISIFSLALSACAERKAWKFALILVLAMCFHKEAIIGLFLYFMKDIKIDTMKGFFMLVAEAVITSIYDFRVIIGFLLQLVPLPNIYDTFVGYTQNDWGHNAHSFSLFDPRMVLYFVIFIFTSYYLNKKDRMQRILINASFITISMMILFRFQTIFVLRLSSFYSIFSIISVPLIIRNYCDTYYGYGKDSTYAMGGVRKADALKLFFVSLYFLLAVSYATKSALSGEYVLFHLL